MGRRCIMHQSQSEHGTKYGCMRWDSGITTPGDHLGRVTNWADLADPADLAKLVGGIRDPFWCCTSAHLHHASSSWRPVAQGCDGWCAGHALQVFIFAASHLRSFGRRHR